MRANRARLVAACLTLCQAWACAGRPPAARSLGSFETWSQTLGGILHGAGVPGFLGNLDEVMEASDSEGGTWRAFIQLWWDRFGSAEVGVNDLHQVALHTDPPFPLGDGSERSQRTRLGTVLAKMRDRVFRLGDRQFRVDLTRILHKAQRFRLVAEAALEGSASSTDGQSKARGWEPQAESGNLVREGSHPQAIEKNGSGEPWEPWEPFPTPIHARAHARMKENTQKASPGSQGSHFADNSKDFSGEPRQKGSHPGSHPPEPPWLEGVP
ncbi:MAG: hypothetical protein ACKOC9_15475 [Alphaproteobacteria bacterium]